MKLVRLCYRGGGLTVLVALSIKASISYKETFYLGFALSLAGDRVLDALRRSGFGGAEYK